MSTVKDDLANLALDSGKSRVSYCVALFIKLGQMLPEQMSQGQIVQGKMVIVQMFKIVY